MRGALVPRHKRVRSAWARGAGRAAAWLAVLSAGVATPVFAADGAPTTRLVRCGTQSCLLVSGHRESDASAVLINGHPVQVDGGRKWRVRLPVETIQGWSVPFARTIEVSMKDDLAKQVTSRKARLPIGLLGHAPDLASLIITLH